MIRGALAIVAFSVSAHMIVCSAAHASTWTSLAPALIARQEVAAAAANGKLYLIGGIGQDRAILDSVEEYDPATNTWRFVAPLPQPLHHAAAATVGDAIYVIGGYRTLAFDPTPVVYRYANNQWMRVADLPRARGALAAATIDGRIYAVGGVPGTRELTMYDPATDRWTTLAPMPTAREHLAAASHGSFLYAIGGRVNGNVAALERYDPATNVWTALPPMPTARAGIAAAVLRDRIHVFGGEGNPATATGVFAENEVYDVATNRWLRDTAMQTPRHGIAAATLGDRIHIPAGSPLQGFGTTNVHDALTATTERRRAKN